MGLAVLKVAARPYKTSSIMPYPARPDLGPRAKPRVLPSQGPVGQRRENWSAGGERLPSSSSSTVFHFWTCLTQLTSRQV